MFINDIGNYVGINDNVTHLNGMPINYLLYADNVILLAQTEKDLQKSVQDVADFCKDWGMIVNNEKSKVLVFNKSGDLVKINIMLKIHILKMFKLTNI